MSECRLEIPLDAEKIGKLVVGDFVYLSGIVYTGRDKAHQRMLEVKETPFQLRGGVIFHCGPLVRKIGGGYEVLGAGPTTSSRMNSFTPAVLGKYGVKAVVGKGGMSREVVESMRRNKVVYLAMTGGCAVSASDAIKKVGGVFWEDLGLPEAVWKLYVMDFGPLIVAIDAHGNSLYEDVRVEVERNLKRVLTEL